MAVRMTTTGKFIVIFFVVAAIVGGLYYLNSNGLLAPKGHQAGKGEVKKGIFSGKSAEVDVIKVGVVTWGGYAGGEYQNRGFQASEESRYFKDYGIKVSFKVIDDFNASREAWKADEVNVLWTTIDAFPTEAVGLADYEPKVIFQADWSRGGDAIVVRQGINSTNDLMGKKVAVAFGTPSHTFLLYALDAGNLNYSDIEVVEVASAIDAAATFKAGKVDAAVVWSPDDDGCVQAIAGSKVLMSTKKAQYIIADVFFAKKAFIEKNREQLQRLVEGWMKGAAELNASDPAKKQAAKILNAGFTGVDEGFCYNAINNARLCTYGDNQLFFEMKPGATMTGRRLYDKMTKIYKMINLVRGNVPSFDDVVDLSILQSIGHLANDASQVAEGKTTYSKPTEKIVSSKAISTKRITITFSTGSSALDENSKQVIEFKFGDIASMSTNRIRIEGNTDNVGSIEANMALSKKRAQSVANFLSQKFNISPNRFVIIGNGPNQPVANNSTSEGREKNRRTDFELLEE